MNNYSYCQRFGRRCQVKILERLWGLLRFTKIPTHYFLSGAAWKQRTRAARYLANVGSPGDFLRNCALRLLSGGAVWRFRKEPVFRNYGLGRVGQLVEGTSMASQITFGRTCCKHASIGEQIERDFPALRQRIG
jgi:hypothetical protein